MVQQLLVVTNCNTVVNWGGCGPFKNKLISFFSIHLFPEMIFTLWGWLNWALVPAAHQSLKGGTTNTWMWNAVGHRVLLSLPGICLEKGKKHFIFLPLSDEKLQAGGVCLVSSQSHFLHFQSCLFVEFWAPKHPPCSISLPPQERIGCETDTSQGHQEGTAAFSLPPPAPSSPVYIKHKSA